MAAHQKEVLTRIFNGADKNNNGVLEFNEVKVLLEKRGYREERIREMFNKLDVDGDQKVTLDEFLSVLGTENPKQRKEASMRQVFQMFDQNGDGTVDSGELKAVFKEMGKNFSDDEITKMMEQADQNKDGILQYEEFVQHFMTHSFR